jgi:hypothetical protein
MASRPGLNLTSFVPLLLAIGCATQSPKTPERVWRIAPATEDAPPTCEEVNVSYADTELAFPTEGDCRRSGEYLTARAQSQVFVLVKEPTEPGLLPTFHCERKRGLAQERPNAVILEEFGSSHSNCFGTIKRHRRDALKALIESQPTWQDFRKPALVGNVVVGMPAALVLVVWGKPSIKNLQEDAVEVWHYRRTKLTFVEGSVARVDRR